MRSLKIPRRDKKKKKYNQTNQAARKLAFYMVAYIRSVMLVTTTTNKGTE